MFKWCFVFYLPQHTRLVYVIPQQYGAIMSKPTTEIFQTTAYPSGGVGVTSQQYQVPPTQNIEAGAQQPPPYKQ